MACTATATKAVAAEIAARFAMRDPLQVRSGFDRPNLSFDVVRLEGKARRRGAGAARSGPADPANRPAIVYCGTRRDSDEAAESLRAGGRSALAYHAGMEAEDRDAAQRRFMDGEVDVVVATNAFGMGVDKADVRSVWHLAIPTGLEAYYQEAGRAGRDGKPARAVLLAMKADLGRLVRFNQQRAGDPELAIARERGWRDYRTDQGFRLLGALSAAQRSRPLRRPAGGNATRSLLRCLRPLCWLPDPETIAAARRGGAQSGGHAAPALCAGDGALLERLKDWRLRAAAGKPAFTVAHNSTLEAIAATKPATRKSCWRSAGSARASFQVRRRSAGPGRRVRAAHYLNDRFQAAAAFRAGLGRLPPSPVRGGRAAQQEGPAHRALRGCGALRARRRARGRRLAGAARRPGLLRDQRHRRQRRLRPVLHPLSKHPALIETFRTWGTDFPESIERWQAARARPVLHVTTADNQDGHELISPRGIATGGGDGYLIRLNRLFWAKKMRAYIRPLGEPNRCLNVYASYDCVGKLRDAAHTGRAVGSSAPWRRERRQGPRRPGAGPRPTSPRRPPGQATGGSGELAPGQPHLTPDHPLRCEATPRPGS